MWACLFLHVNNRIDWLATTRNYPYRLSAPHRDLRLLRPGTNTPGLYAIAQLGFQGIHLTRVTRKQPKRGGSRQSADNQGNSLPFRTIQKYRSWLVVLTCFNHLEKYESQWEGLSHILWNITNDWNHQPGSKQPPQHKLKYIGPVGGI